MVEKEKEEEGRAKRGSEEGRTAKKKCVERDGVQKRIIDRHDWIGFGETLKVERGVA